VSLNILIKKLNKTFNKPNTDNFKLTGDHLCHECVVRHNELYKGKIITFEDLKSSCYTHLFYESHTFVSIIPILLKELLIKQKLEIDQYIMEYFFKKMRDTQLFERSYFTHEQIYIIIETLEYIQSLYNMECYEIWDDQKEEIIYYFEEESLYAEIEDTLIFWKEHL